MSQSREIYAPGASLKGTKFRATSDGETVWIQRKSEDSAQYRTTNKISFSEWEEFSKKHDLDNNDDPHPIAMLSRPNPFE